MKIAKVKYNDISNGNGIRTSVFVSGCTHGCEGCFNREAFDFSYGELYTEELKQKVIESLRPKHIEGLTLLGGEPMHLRNIGVTLDLIDGVRKEYGNTKTIWVYTGYTYEELQTFRDLSVEAVFWNIDYMVDGKFVQALYSPTLRFRGSANQRVIDMIKTCTKRELVLADI